jgi:hypothetical protein
MEDRLLLLTLPWWLLDCWLDWRCRRCMMAGAMPPAVGWPSCRNLLVPLCSAGALKAVVTLL